MGYGHVGPRTLSKMKEAYGAGSSTTAIPANTNTNRTTHTTMITQERATRIIQIQKEITHYLSSFNN